MNKFAKEKIEGFYTIPMKTKIKKISEKDLASIPILIRNYLKKINILEKETIKRVRLKQNGHFKLNPDSKWKPFSAKQYVNTENLSFLWYAKIKMIPLVNVHVIDQYIQGKGKLNAKLLNLIKIVDEQGIELDQGEFLRFLSEMPWYPSFYLNKKITWGEINNKTLEVKLNHKDTPISGRITFNDKGLINEFTAKRYYTNRGISTIEDWHGFWDKYKKINGILIPTKFKVCWHLDSGNYCYIRGTITEIGFNILNLY